MVQMDAFALRKEIRRIIREKETSLHVVSAKKVGIDHKDGYSIQLSDGTEDYAPLEGFMLKDYQAGMYGCKIISGVLLGRKHRYLFSGIDCEEYVEVDVNSITLQNQIS